MGLLSPGTADVPQNRLTRSPASIIPCSCALLQQIADALLTLVFGSLNFYQVGRDVSDYNKNERNYRAKKSRLGVNRRRPAYENKRNRAGVHNCPGQMFAESYQRINAKTHRSQDQTVRHHIQQRLRALILIREWIIEKQTADIGRAVKKHLAQDFA